MNQWIVLDALKQITDLDEEGATCALPLCRSSIEEIRLRVREGTDENDPRVLRATAAMAYYKLTLKRLDSDELFSSFKAGDITVSKSPKAKTEMLEDAVKVRDDALLAALPVFKDEEFLFMNVGD